MTQHTPTPEEVAHFLKSNPEFFQDHAGIFAELRVPHPHETRAISLGERQILTLRSRCKELEWKLAGLLHNASGNERISRLLMQWCCDMLAQDDAQALPELIVERLQDIFELPAVVIRLWDKEGPAPFVQDVGDALKQYASALATPYCGPAKNCPAGEWLEPGMTSLACIALRPDGGRNAYGMLVLGSEDPSRFTSDMGTDFLETIGRLASGALQRLPDLAVSDTA
ncbi:MAG TPA: DUF484 family protein [Burkholderiaceae bacterium]|nr:DUF484 family protein [Burkholderiaceae bacterium]